MRLDEQGLDGYTDRFDADAFRHEVLDTYDVASDGDAFGRWRAGEPVDPAVTVPWVGWVRAQLARNAKVRRLRTLTGPPSEYVRFEAEVFYTANTTAGEEIRILDLTETARPEGLVIAEYWMLDHERAAVMCYHPDGRFSHAETLEGVGAQRLRQARDTAWDAAVPFVSWWGEHPQYHGACG